MSIGQPPFLSVIVARAGPGGAQGQAPEGQHHAPVPGRDVGDAGSARPSSPTCRTASSPTSPTPVPTPRRAVPGARRREGVPGTLTVNLRGLPTGPWEVRRRWHRHRRADSARRHGDRTLGGRGVGVDRAFGGVQALRDASFAARPGEIHALAGENGAGKSTLIKVLCGLVSADRGTVEIFGQPVGGWSSRPPARGWAWPPRSRSCRCCRTCPSRRTCCWQDPPRGPARAGPPGPVWSPEADAILDRFGVDYIDPPSTAADLSRRAPADRRARPGAGHRAAGADPGRADRGAAGPAGRVALRAHAPAARAGLLRHLHLAPVARDRDARRPGHGVPQRRPRRHPRARSPRPRRSR